MKNEILKNALSDWAYWSEETRKVVEAMPSDQWEFSPHPTFATFSKQVRHAICCRGVFAQGFMNRKIDFSKKHDFYSGSLLREDLLLELAKSAVEVQKLMAGLENIDLKDYHADYYGEPLSFLEHFSALVSHEATHRGQWMLYMVLAKKV